MATLPQAIDYGSRPSLRSSRVDVPGSGNMEFADALANAASTFTKMAIDHKQKDDALNYANAKNEYLIADIKERAKLKDDKDYETFEPRYREAMKGHYDRLFPTVTSNRDRSLFDAEARLMNERGAVQVSDLSRTKEIDYEVGKYYSDTELNKQAMLVEQAPQIVNDMMITQADRVDAMVERGYFDETEGQAEKQRVVQAWATDRLIDMDPQVRAMMLERSIEGREAGGPITVEDLRAGKGNDSIADFLHYETAVKMLRETQVENEIDDENAAARAVVEAAYAAHPDNAEAANAMARKLAKNEGLDGSTYERMEGMLTSRSNEVTRNKNALQDRIITENTDFIANGKLYEDISGAELKHLTPAQRESLRIYSGRMQTKGQGFADIDQLVPANDGANSYATWRNLTDAEKAEVPLDQSDWVTPFTADTWQFLKDEQDRIKNSTKKAPTLPGGLTNSQLVLGTLVSNGTIPQTMRDPENNETYQRTLLSLDKAIQIAQEEKGSALTNMERRKLLAEVMQPTAFTDSYYNFPFFGTAGRSTSAAERSAIATMTADEIKRGRLPIEEAAEEVASISSTGIQTTYKQGLEQWAADFSVEPSQLEYERAYFAAKNGMGKAEILRRLGVSEDVIFKLESE